MRFPKPSSRTSEEFLRQVERVADQYQLAFLALWSVMFFLVTGTLAAEKLLWADELITSYLSRLPSTHAIWLVLIQGGDAHPPLSFLLVHWSYGLFGVNHLSSRIPFILGFWVMCVCIFFFVQQTCGVLYGFAAMTLPLLSGAYAYAYESRPYALVLGAAAASLLAWQLGCRRASAWPRIALAVALAIAISSHFFALFLWLPLLCGEFARTLKNRKADIPMWVAIVAGLIPLPFYFPIVQAIRTSYFQWAFWASPSFASVADTYRLMVLAEPPLLLAILICATLQIYLGPPAARAALIPLEEGIAVVVLFLFPVYVVAAACLVGAYTERYGIPVIIGVTLGLTYLSWSRMPGKRLVPLVALCVFLGWFLVKQTLVIERQRSKESDSGTARPFEREEWVVRAAETHLPLVLTDGVFFTQVQEYAPLQLKNRLVYLASPAKAMEMGLSPAGETNVLTVDRLLHKMPVVSYEEFSRGHGHFMLCAKVRHEGWLLKYLLKSGARLQLKYDGEVERLFEVFLE